MNTKNKDIHQLALRKFKELEHSNVKITLDDVAINVAQDMEQIRQGVIEPEVGEVLMKGWRVVGDLVKEARKKRIEDLELELNSLLKTAKDIDV